MTKDTRSDHAAVLSTHFFTSSLEYWEADWDGDAVKAGIAPGSTKADYIDKPYVEDFALATFPMLFKPWFWSLLAVLVLGIAWRTRQRNFAPEITMLATSALCYVFGYFPIVPANHFRYTLWPALAVTVAVIFVLAGRRSRGSAGTPRSRAFSESET